MKMNDFLCCVRLLGEGLIKEDRLFKSRKQIGQCLHTGETFLHYKNKTNISHINSPIKLIKLYHKRKKKETNK